MDHKLRKRIKRMDIKGMKKDRVLLALYNHAIIATDQKLFFATVADIECATIWEKDYGRWEFGKLCLGFCGTRTLNIDITGDSFDPTAYNSANGAARAKKAINSLRMNTNYEKDSREQYRQYRRGIINDYLDANSRITVYDTPCCLACFWRECFKRPT